MLAQYKQTAGKALNSAPRVFYKNKKNQTNAIQEIHLAITGYYNNNWFFNIMILDDICGR